MSRLQLNRISRPSTTATVFLLTAAMRNRNRCARKAVSGEMGKSNINELSDPSRRRMVCEMSHNFCATVPC